MEEGKGIDLYAENLTSIEKKLFLFSFFFFYFVFFRIRLFEERKFDDLFFTKEFSFFISHVLSCTRFVGRNEIRTDQHSHFVENSKSKSFLHLLSFGCIEEKKIE